MGRNFAKACNRMSADITVRPAKFVPCEPSMCFIDGKQFTNTNMVEIELEIRGNPYKLHFSSVLFNYDPLKTLTFAVQQAVLITLADLHESIGLQPMKGGQA